MADLNETEQEPRSGLSDLTEGLAAIDDDMVLKAVYDSGLHQYAPGVLRTVWKDGIDLDEPSLALMNFAKKICKAANAKMRRANDKNSPADKIVGSTDGLSCNTGGLVCCAREAEEFELVLGRTCDQCSMVRTELDDTLYICDPRGEKVSDGMTCDAFDAT